MREILFRGKRTDNGEWVYGMPCATEQSGIYAIQTLQGGIFDVIPDTVGQYTGLTDKNKNGKKIFEGDILEFSDRLVEVFWHAHLGCWDCNFLQFTNKENSRDDMSPRSWKWKSKVIGNIHDNPELLKGE